MLTWTSNHERAMSSSITPPPLSPPGRLGLLGETRTALDLLTMLGPLASAQLRAPRERARRRTVVAVPGFGADARFFAPLRHYLRRHGYDATDWGLGRNLAGVNLRHRLEDISSAWPIEARAPYRGEGGVPYLCERFVEHLRQRHEPEPVTLLGWSLGGYIAREVARDLPQLVEQVITLGAPTVGGPKYTLAAPFFTRRGMDLDWIESVIADREREPIRQPITAIYSRSDGIVNWQASLDGHSPNVRHVHVPSAHVGLVFNPRVWTEVLRALGGLDESA